MSRVFLGLIFTLSFVGSSFGADNKSGEVNNNSGASVVEIDGVKMSMADVERKKLGAIFQAKNTFYQAERKALEDFVDDYLLERQAARENLTVEQLLDKHVNKVVDANPPSEEALRLYYEGVNTPESYEAIRPKIIDHIRELRLQKTKTAYMKSLRSEANVSMHLPMSRMTVAMDNTPVRGDSHARVTVVEYADYECPVCQQFEPTLSRLEQEFKGRIVIGYKDVPLPMHSHAEKAAEAARCAAAQGKFWEYHDALFTTKQLDTDQLKAHARNLSLDGKKFDACLDSGEQARVVKKDYDEAQSLQLQGTPSFLINGRFFSGGMPYDQLKALIEEELDLNRQTQTAQR